MRGLEWGRLYEEYHGKSYNPKKVSEKLKELYAHSGLGHKRNEIGQVFNDNVEKWFIRRRV